MSIPETTSPRIQASSSEPGRWLLLAIAVLTGIAIALSFFSFDEGHTFDLRLQSPTIVRAGSIAGLRAIALSADVVPKELDAAVTVELVDEQSNVLLSSVKLSPSSVGGYEGRIDIPNALKPLLLVASTEAYGKLLRTTRKIHVVSDDGSIQQHYRSLSKEAAEFRSMPIVFQRPSGRSTEVSLRVQGGACIPELECTLLAYVSGDPIELIFEPIAGVVSVDGPKGQVSGTQIITLLVRGNHASVSLALAESGKIVSKEHVSLPLALGGLSLRRATEFANEDDHSLERPFKWKTIHGDENLAVDVFANGQWVDSLSFKGGKGTVTLDAKTTETILQARMDVYSDASAGTLAFPSGKSSSSGMLFDAAALESKRVLIEPASRSLLESRAKIGRHDRQRRIALALGVLLLGICAASLFLRRGLASEAEADSMLRAAGSLGPPSRLRRMRLFVGALFLLGIFLVVAAIVLSRGVISR